jgi:hypothetical protein
MKLYACTDFVGKWPVGTAAVILADTDEQARELLRIELKAAGLGNQNDFRLYKIPQTKCMAVILLDGDY